MAKTTVIAQATGVATDTEQKRLKLGPSEAVLRALRRREDGLRFSYEHVVLPLARFPGWAPDSEMTPDLRSLARDHGIVLGQATERVALVKASRDISEQLGLDEGTLVMRLDRIVETADGHPVEWRIAYVDRQTAGDEP